MMAVIARSVRRAEGQSEALDLICEWLHAQGMD
jgi:hypothetical protein